LLGGLIIRAAGTGKLSEMGGLLRRHPLLGWMFFVTALAIAGIPPLSGFAGKLLIVRGGFAGEQYALAAISLATSFVVLYSLVRIFMAAFWGDEKGGAGAAVAETKKPALMLPAACLFVIVVGMGLGSEWMYEFAGEAGRTLLDPSIYVQAVLKE
jgi:multicomponent Na+:H+ antiporter subunit D